MRPNDLDDMRKSLRAALEAVPKEARVGWLEERMAEGEPAASFARLLALSPAIGLDLKAGVKLARRALESFEAGEGERGLPRRFLRDAHVAVGNFFAHHGDRRRALEHYRAAAVGETDPERRAVVVLNVAKLFLGEGSFHEALSAARRVDVDALSRTDVREALRVLRARVLVVLGAEAEASRLLAAGRGLRGLDRRVETERRYVGFMARAPWSSAAVFERRAGDLCAWAEAECDARVAAFYELETMVLRRVAQPESVKSRARFLARAQYLADHSGAHDLRALLAALDPVVYDKRASDVAHAALEDALRDLAGSQHHLLYLALSLLVARHLVRRRQFERAATHLLLRGQVVARLRAPFPKALLARIDAAPSVSRELARSLAASVEAAGAADEDETEVATWVFK